MSVPDLSDTPLDADHTLDEDLFLWFEQCGERGEEFICIVLNGVDYDRETLGDTAEALGRAGRSDIGDIVWEIAHTKKSGIEKNPYDKKTQPTNWYYWRNSWIRQRRMKTGELFESLRRREAKKARNY